ncbi:MAG: PorT family protein [Bacteroidaceae bacterium]|nr:PorT family protein [Bacteroidaceae bacterium]
MKTIKLLLGIVLLALGSTAKAQFANSTTAVGTRQKSLATMVTNDCSNYNRFNFSYSTLKLSEFGLEDTYPGFRFGWTGGYSVVETVPFFLETGVDFSFNTKVLEEDKYSKEKSTTASLIVPLQLAYKLSFQNGTYISPYTGFHFKVNVLGKDTETSYHYDETESYNWFDEDYGSYRRFQMGWRIGGNIGYKAFNFNVGYMLDFIPLCKEGGEKIKTSSVHVGIGVNF